MKRRKEACLLSPEQSRASIRQRVCSQWDVLVAGLKYKIVNKATELDVTQLMIKLSNCLPEPCQTVADFPSISCLIGRFF